MSEKTQNKMDSTINTSQKDQSDIIVEKCKTAGDNKVKKYHKGPFLGKGGFARCYEVTNIETKKVTAIKIVNKETLKKSKAKQKLITEIKIHKSLIHKNVIGFDHVFEDADNIYILLELCKNYTLNEMLKRRKRISELQVQYYVSHIIEGVIFLHSNKVIHRDLKLGNLMLNENMEVKIGDFGLAAKLEFHNEKRKTICGTPNYLAPEIIDGKGHSYEVDIWSIGVIIYALLYGRPPFETNEAKKTYKRIKECQYAFDEDVNISYNAKNLISRLLVVDPSKRLTLEQIMGHPFMSVSKIPKQLPVSVLRDPLQRSFIEQYTFYSEASPLKNSHKTMKTLEKMDNEYDKLKLHKGISERVLLRNSGFNKNYFCKSGPSKKDDSTAMFYNTQKPSTLSNNFFSRPDTSEKMKRKAGNSSTVFVKKWVDYSSKYGLGYLLSDGSTGIYFNDATKMSLEPTGEKIDYIFKENEDSKRLVTVPANIQCEDREINKKITLMQYFRKYLNGSNTSEPVEDKKEGCPPFVYIKKWIKSEKAILFRLNNKIIQVNFYDRSQVIIYCDKNTMLYSDPNHSEKYHYSLDSDSKKSPEFSTKLDHIKQLLTKITKATNENCMRVDTAVNRETFARHA